MAQKLSNLPIGAKVKFGKYSVNGEVAQEIIWLVVAKSHSSSPAYPTNSVTLLTEKIIDLRYMDAPETQTTDTGIATYGNNRYSLCNMDQWLNKDSPAGMWYSPQHTGDQSPNSVANGRVDEYASRPGFLNGFTLEEKSAILSTTIRVVKSINIGGGYEDISRKVFLPSITEVGLMYENAISEGSAWAYFNNGSRISSLTLQAFTNTLITKPKTIDDPWTWLLRTPVSSTTNHFNRVYIDGSPTPSPAVSSDGIRPALNLDSSVSITDNTDADGCYVVIFNEAPLAPTVITTPSRFYGGKPNTISWNVATDPNGDQVTYQLDCSIDGGSYEQIYNGTAIVYAHLVPFGTSTVSYRVKATDPSGESSAYTTSATVTVINNNAPVISGSDSNLGVKSDDFTGTYTITDANSDAVTVTEAIDGVPIRSLVATLGQTITYGVTENTWLALPNGSHTLTISATDGIDTTVRTYVFTKLVDTLKIQNTTPWVSSTMPSRIMLVITRNIPSAATFKVEVCNNGYDASPTWEDATDPVMSGLVHVFSNKTKTAANWGVLVRVTVERNGATGACYVSAIGGNFE